jgi:hypothetical protein
MQSNNYFNPRTVDGNAFSGFVLPVPEPEQPQQTQQPPPPRLLFDGALQAIANVTIEVQLRDSLIISLRDIGQQANDLLARAHAARLEDLRQQHRKVVRECRKQKERIDELLTNMGQMESSIRNAAEESGKARLLVIAAERNSPSPESYPTEKEKQDYALVLHNLRERLAAAEREESSWNASYAALATNLTAARQEMALSCPSASCNCAPRWLACR